MKFTILCLLGLASFGLADYTMYCNSGENPTDPNLFRKPPTYSSYYLGTAGDGRCEKEGYYTFCVCHFPVPTGDTALLSLLLRRRISTNNTCHSARMMKEEST
jgi:hypothetical protein